MTRRWLAFIAVGAVLLSGCSKKQEANDTLPSPSAAETTQELPPLGPAAFPVPSEAREKTPAGTVEFVRYYVSLAKYLADHSLDPGPLLDLSQDCQIYSEVAESLAQDKASNYTYREYAFEFREYGPGLVHGDTAEMGFTYTQGPITVIDASGQVVPERSSQRTSELQSGAVLLWRDELKTWVITTLTVG